MRPEAFVLKTHTVDQAVRYAETDRMSLVHHSTYLLWFELGRTGLLSEAGFPYGELEASGTLFPVVVFACRLNGSADYGDTVTIETRISSLRSRSVEFSYRILKREEVIATGMTRHVAMDAARKIKRLPEDLLRALGAYVDTSTGS
jgi:acyl-CoA thioester hydrolase